MSTITINVAANDEKLDQIIHQLKALTGKVNIMPTKEEFDAKIAAIADEVRANDDIINSIAQNTVKIFDEVKGLVDSQTGVIDMAGLEALQASVVAQTANLASAAAQSTAIDGLIPDVVPPVV